VGVSGGTCSQCLTNGAAFTVELELKEVWYDPTGEVLKNGKQELMRCERLVERCKFEVPSGFGTYCMTSVGSGRYIAYI